MPISQQQWEGEIADDLVKKYLDGVTWGQVVTALQNAAAGDRNQAILALKKSQNARLGQVIAKLVNTELRDLAVDEAATILADDQMSITEHNRWRGDG